MRSSLKYAIEKLGKIGKAVEVGVRDGINSLEILKGVDYLYLVDSYPVYEEMWSDNPGGQGKFSPKPKVLTKEFQQMCKTRMLDHIRPYNNVKFLELSSVEASKQFEDNSLDYVYIDACHNYEHCLEDIITWFPKTKVLGGHDFHKPHFPGVTQAVVEFATENNLKVVYNGDSDWWLKKKNLRVVSFIYNNPFKPYNKMCETLQQSAKDNGYESTIYPATKEEVGACRMNDKLYIKCAGRPMFVKEVLDDVKDDLIWMDLDCIIKKPLGEVLTDCDIAVTLRRIEDRTSQFMEKFKFINSGVMFFKNNLASRKFCDLWHENIGAEECDQDGLNNLLMKYSKLDTFGEIIKIDDIRVKVLPCEEYNFFYFPEDSSRARVLHYKGFSYKKEMIYG